ncbi:MAG: hypothetical protein ABI200_05295 [Gaiellales bacterium]
MQLVAPATVLAPRPKPAPDFAGVRLGTIFDFTKRLELHSTGTIGRAEGYDSSANAMRAARMLSRGEAQGAAAVVGYEGRFYVQGTHAKTISREGSMKFEAQFPAMVAGFRLEQSHKVTSALLGFQALVDGARQVEVKPLDAWYPHK